MTHSPVCCQPPGTEALWQETRGLVRREEGVLVLDDTTLDKPYAKRMELVSRHWSGKHKRVVWGINLLTLLWTDGNALIPCDFRVYDRPLSGLTKNDHFRRMLEVAEGRGFQPRWVLFDSWYTSLENLKAIRDKGWFWLSQLRSNRQVNPEGAGNLPLATVAIPQEGRRVHLRGYGFIRVFRTVSKDGDVEHWATNDLEMTEQQRENLARQAWGIGTIGASNNVVAFAYGRGTAESHPPVPPSLPAAGSPPLERRSLLVRVQSQHHPVGLTRLPG